MAIEVEPFIEGATEPLALPAKETGREANFEELGKDSQDWIRSRGTSSDMIGRTITSVC